MPKLKLQIENLAVESFEAGARGRGTVLGASVIEPASAQPPCFLETEITGPCCDVTLAISCVLTNCIQDCAIVTWDPCA